MGEAEDWKTYPACFFAYYGNERIIWIFSFMMHLAFLRFEDPAVAKEFKTDIKEILKTYKVFLNCEEFKTYFRDKHQEKWEDRYKDRAQRVNINLNNLLTDLGTLAQPKPHEVVRHLLNQIVYNARHHNPLVTTLNLLVQELDTVIDLGEDFGSGKSGDPGIITTRETQRTIEAAMNTVGVLEEIASSIQHLFGFTEAKRGDIEAFVAENGNSNGFKPQVVALGHCINRIRKQNKVTRNDLNQILDLRKKIEDPLWEKNGIVQKTVRSYVVDFLAEVKNAVDWANNQFLHMPWNPEKKKIFRYEKPELPTGESTVFVLMKPDWLTEILKNILVNVRHGFKQKDLTAPVQEGIKIKFFNTEKPMVPQQTHTDESKKKVGIVITSPGTMSTDNLMSGDTLARQITQVAWFDGSLEFINDSDTVTTKLMLLQRKPIRSRK